LKGKHNNSFSMYVADAVESAAESRAEPELQRTPVQGGAGVYDLQGQLIGQIKDILLNKHSGQVSYAVLSFASAFNVGEKLLAVPWNTLILDSESQHYTLNVDIGRLRQAPGFDQNHWPNMSDQTWQKQIRAYYGSPQ